MRTWGVFILVGKLFPDEIYKFFKILGEFPSKKTQFGLGLEKT
jgi:hypothetical protein